MIVFLILKRASISQRIAEQGKRARPHPEASPHADVDGRWALLLASVASTAASGAVVKRSWSALPSNQFECEEGLRTAGETERRESEKEGLWTKTKRGAGR